MIQELTLDNWKSFKHATLNIDPLTFIIGTNASGKSNILDAFLFLNRIANGRSISAAINGENELQAIRGGSDWMIRKEENECMLSVLISTEKEALFYRYTIHLRKTEKGDGCELKEEKLTRINKTTKKDTDLFWTNNENPGMAYIPTYFYTARQGRAKRLDLNRNYCVLSQIENLNVIKETKEAVQIVLSKLCHIFILDPITNHMRGYAKLSETLASDASNIAGVLAALDRDRQTHIESELTNFLRPLPEKDIEKVWAEKVGRFGTDAMLYCKEKWNENISIEVDARGMSDGTLRFLSIVAALLTGKKKSLLIVEEIDNGLHPSRATELVKVLKTLGEQNAIDILCTTHNPVLIDALGRTMLPFISYVKRNENSGVSEIELLEELEHLPKLMAGNTLGDLMTKGAI